MREKISKESKLHVAKDIVASYVRGNENLSADEVCELLKKVYNAVDDLVPDPNEQRIGLA